ncbi:hypothetical protein EXX16_24405, partial [Escherichia coli]
GTVCVVGKIRDLILQLSKSSIYSTKSHVAVYFQIASVLTHIKHIVLNITTKRSCSLFTLSFLP